MNDDVIREEAIRFASKSKIEIANQITDHESHPSEKYPVSVFMAGSPGAGKTETSKKLLELFAGNYDVSGYCSNIIRIDADELRLKFKNYNGPNAELFQAGVSILVEKIHDTDLKRLQSFVFDGTLSNFNKSQQNIERSLKRDRRVQIIYVFKIHTRLGISCK